MFKNFWYAIQHGSKVGDQPVKVRIMEENLVVWRDDRGKPVVQSDLCVHRGGSLAGGWVQKGVNGHNCVVCPYHGWQFDDAGACVRIPAASSDVAIPRKARTDTYPSVERYGFIWAFLGDLSEDERPPMPELPGLEETPDATADGYRMVEGEFVWNANIERVIENGADIAHAPFVHAGSFGNPDSPEVPEHEIVETWSDDGEYLRMIEATVDLVAPPSKGLWSLINRGKDKPPVNSSVRIMFPNVSMLEVKLPLGSMKIWTAHVPIDENTTASRWITGRNFFTKPWQISLLRADADTYRRTMKIFYEDQATVEAQTPELVPFDIASELNVKSDQVSLAFRRWRANAYDRGWGIQPHQIVTTDDKRKYTVIPSPARKEHPDLENAWVLKEVESHAAIRARQLAAGKHKPGADDSETPPDEIDEGAADRPDSSTEEPANG
ncbi:MAG: aromatic ring-hydroxylating dioxygenase subunit alpha [Actinomycetia bacterium]|nr:aromatic ring-hydroxylating dioxygenase subunit alpha [Actinomycetes bacterium]